VIRRSAHLATLFPDVPWLDRPAAARAAGFDLVDSRWPPSGLDRAWPAALRAAGLDVACLNAYAGDYATGERGILTDPARREEAVAAFADAVELARAVGAPRINVPVGRGGTYAAAVAALRECAALAETAGLTLLVEPINAVDFPGYLVPTAPEAAALIEEVSSDAVRLLYDAYHAAMGGADPVQEVRAYVPLVAHVHYADWPGRGPPGTGRLSLERLEATLVEAGYEGAVGLEYVP
jgi:hydroxypyruvate isomerase